MNSVREVISALGGPSKVAARARLVPNTVVYWQSRNRIPVEYWEDIIGMAKKEGVSLKHADLLHACSPRKLRAS